MNISQTLTGNVFLYNHLCIWHTFNEESLGKDGSLDV